jgi:hypothetical protein
MIALSSSVAAGVHHPDMAKGKIVPDWIDGVDRAQRRSDFGGHLPVWCAIPRQGETAAETNDVRIERNDEPGWGHECPHSEIDFVAPHHPAQKQIEPLAGASGRRAGEEITDTGSPGNSAVSAMEVCLQGSRRKRVERGPDIRRAGIVACHEETLDRTRFTQHSLQDEQQRNEIPTSDPAVDDRIDRGSIARRVEAPHETGWVRAHGSDERLDGVQYARNAAERERCGAEPDDLSVLRRRIAPDDMDRIGCGVDVIECPVEIVETRRQLVSRIPDPGSRIPTTTAISGTA